MAKRQIIAFPDTETFWDRVMDRLYAVVERYVFIDSEIKFTLFINAIPRDKGERVDIFNPKIKYQGIERQRQLLEYENPMSIFDQNWIFLGSNKYFIKDMAVSQQLFDKLRKNKSKKLNSYYRVGDLKSYFFNVRKQTKYQKNELPILNHYFNIEKDRYLSVPLIQFGEIDGVVHIIYEDAGHNALNDSIITDLGSNIKDIIAGFSIEYEGVILAWHLAIGDEDLNRELRRSIDRVGKKYKDIEKKNPNPVYEKFWNEEANTILKILNYQSYYTTHYNYYQSRLANHDRIRADLYTRILRQAVITVLLDSYAHNISAHALTTLSWITSKRAEHFSREETIRTIKDIFSSTDFNSRFKPLPAYEGTYKTLVSMQKPLSRELFPLFRFLQEKGGFWSGLTRDTNPGGLTMDMFTLLWEDFSTNALYLGTIAESEGIRKLHIDVSIGKHVAYRDEMVFIRENPALSPRRLVTIDLDQENEHEYVKDKDDFRILTSKTQHELWYQEHPELESLSRFVHPADDFPKLKQDLKQIKVFLPGGVVGKHAFYTIIENELRNIKHFSGEELANAVKNGLVLNISLQEADLDKNGGNELYRVGIGLKLQTQLSDSFKRENESRYLITRRFNALYDDIIDDENDNKPRLSGNSQDKVCAAFLFNGHFSSVQNGSLVWYGFYLPSPTFERDKAFYPWITPAVAPATGGQEYQIPPPGAYYDQVTEKDKLTIILKGRRRYAEIFTKENSTKGYLKKYFYLWRGQDVMVNDKSSEWDNSARFRLVYVSDKEQDDHKNSLEIARKQGAIRLLPIEMYQKQEAPGADLIRAYQAWFDKWLYQDYAAFYFEGEEGGPYGFIVYDKHNKTEPMRFATRMTPSSNRQDLLAQKVDLKEIAQLRQQYPKYQTIQFAHAAERVKPDMVLFRRHGIMNRYFIAELGSPKNLSLVNIPGGLFYEWFEMMAMKACIVDNRIYNRIRLNPHPSSFYEHRLNLMFCPEGEVDTVTDEAWLKRWDDESTRDFIRESHFLVLHLSFMDKILQSRYASDKKYQEGDIALFIQEEVEQKIFKGKLPDNFVLVVTSGRGRDKWWDVLQKDYPQYRKHVTFRSIESLIGAIENNATQNDHFELKYRLTKVLFGS